MTVKNKIQQSKSNTPKEIDVITLIRLQEQLQATNLLLDKIFNRLCLSFESMEKVRQSLKIQENAWRLEEAKEFLDVVITTAALGSPQILENNGWVVRVVSAEE